MDISSLAFNKLLGLRIGRHNDKPEVILQPSAHHLNHVGAVHATVIYGLAEAASGECLLNRFSDLAVSYVAVLRNSIVKYRRPASPDCVIHARGTLTEDSAVEFYERLRSRGRASVDILVAVTQHDAELFTGTFGWFAAAREP